MAPRFAITAASVLAPLVAGAILVACSVETPPSPPSIPSGSSSGSTGPGSSSGNPTSSSGALPDSGANDASSGGTDPVTACVAACEAQHPVGTQIGKGIDACWTKSCPMQCNGIGVGQDKPPTHGTCRNPVSTPAVDCSQCTVDKCCTAWDACFDNADCAALNKCSIACYK